MTSRRGLSAATPGAPSPSALAPGPPPERGPPRLPPGSCSCCPAPPGRRLAADTAPRTGRRGGPPRPSAARFNRRSQARRGTGMGGVASCRPLPLGDRVPEAWTAAGRPVAPRCRAPAGSAAGVASGGSGSRPGRAQGPRGLAPRPGPLFRRGQAWLIEHRAPAARRSAGSACAARGFRRGGRGARRSAGSRAVAGSACAAGEGRGGRGHGLAAGQGRLPAGPGQEDLPPAQPGAAEAHVR